MAIPQLLLTTPKLIDITPREITLIFWRRAKQTTDALHNLGFLLPVARKRGCGCINLQDSIVMAAADGQSNDRFGVLLDLCNLQAYRIDELKFWLKCRGDSLKRLPIKVSCIQR